MKTLILYATKYGATQKIAQCISNNMDSGVLHDLKHKNIPALDQFDCIIIGSSLYAGSIRKEAKEFMSQNLDILQLKKLGLFLSGIEPSNEKTYFDNNFPSAILEIAKVRSFLGGIYNPQKAGILERSIMKIVAKQSGYSNTISKEKIKEFTDNIKT